MKKGFKVVFMGTPDFAVPSLTALHHSSNELLQVVTRPDRPRGRGRKPVAPPVKSAALGLGYDVRQPESVKSEDFSRHLRTLAADLFVIVAFGQIMPQHILEIPRRGCVNVHASLLPRYRGPAPIQWAILNREKETGITTMFMDAGLDTGDILLQATEPILAQDTSETLHRRLADLGARTLISTLAKLQAGTLKPLPQPNERASYAPLLKKEDGRIDWKRPAVEIDAFIRAMNPWPGAFTHLGGRRLKIFMARALDTPSDMPPGTVAPGFPDELRVATGSGVLAILEVQAASCRRLPIDAFLRGCQLSPGVMLA